jgi:hypothetical protein
MRLYHNRNGGKTMIEKVARLSELVLFRLMVVFAFLVMIVVNGLANSIPIGGVTSAEVSDSFPNLFAPAGYTFAIWGVIYLLLGVYTVYQFLMINRNLDDVKKAVFHKIRVYFILSCMANTLWIFAWHYKRIGASVILIVVILISLILINQLLESISLSQKENLCIRLPFSVYFGWITVATIANITTFLVSIGFTGWGISEQGWTVIVLIVGLVIGGVTTWRNQDIAYGLVIIWAYLGILVKHILPSGFGGAYPFVIFITILSIVTMALLLFYIIKDAASNRLKD